MNSTLPSFLESCHKPVPIVCFLLFADQQQPNLKALLQQDTHTWAHGAKISSVDQSDQKVHQITFAKHDPTASQSETASVFIAPIAAPVEPTEDGNLPGRMLWPEDRIASLQQHQSHWIITSMSDDGVSLVDQALMVTQVVDAALRSHPTALGVVWGPDNLRIYGPAFQEIARLHDDEHLPIMIWVAVTIIPGDGDDSPTIASTSGLEMFELMEVESIGSPEPIELLRERLLFLSEYVIERGEVIPNGDTIGLSETDRLEVVHGPSLFDSEKTVMHLHYPEGYRASQGGLAISPRSCGIILACLGGIVGLLVTVGPAIWKQRSNPSHSTTPKPMARAEPAEKPSQNPVAKPAENWSPKSPYEDYANGVNPNQASQSFQPPRPFRPIPPRPDMGLADRRPSMARPPHMNRAPAFPNRPDAANNPNADIQAPTIQPIAQTDTLTSPVSSLNFTRDGKYVTISSRGQVDLYSASTGEKLATGKTDTPFGRLTCSVWDDSNKIWIASNGRGQFLRWQLSEDPTGFQLTRMPSSLHEHPQPAVAMAINAAGTLLVSADAQGQLIWQRLSADNQTQPHSSITLQVGRILDVALDESSMSVRLASSQGVTDVNLKTKQSSPIHTISAQSLRLSPEERICAALAGGRIQVWKEGVSKPLLNTHTAPGIVSQIGFVDRNTVYSVNHSQLETWQIDSGEKRFTVEIPHIPKPLVATNSTQRLVAIASQVTPEAVRIYRCPSD